MASSAVSIDHAASGFLRHRFVRAIAASWLVLVIVVLFGIVVQVLWESEETDAAGYTGYMIGAGLVLVLLLGAIALAAGFVSAVIDVVHRRLLAFLALLIIVPSIAISVIAIIGAVGQLTGWIPPDASEPESGQLDIWQLWAMAAMMTLGGLIVLESFGWAWWQLTTSRAGFFAARGWRPPPWRLISAMRRLAGLPAYISNFGRGRFSLTVIYFLVAVFNLGLIAILCIPFLAFMVERGEDVGPYLIIALLFGGLVVLNLIGVGALIDRFADARATKLYQDVREWDARAPIVFLRSFTQDDDKLRPHTRDPLVRFPAGVGSARTLDEILLEAGSAYGPVIAIGNPRDPTPPLGAARIFVPGPGNEWQHVVTSLVGASKAVVMCPNTSGGVKWELDLLESAEGRVRVIFIANPELSAEANTALFADLAPAGETAPALKKRHAPIAAYVDPKHGWRVLTTAKPPCLQTYSVALNWALQALLGHEGEPVQRPKKRARG